MTRRIFEDDVHTAILEINIKTGESKAHLSYDSLYADTHASKQVIDEILEYQSQWSWLNYKIQKKFVEDNFKDTCPSGFYAYNGYTFIWSKSSLSKGSLDERIKGAILLAKRYYEYNTVDDGYVYGLSTGYNNGYDDGYWDAIREFMENPDTYQHFAKALYPKHHKWIYSSPQYPLRHSHKDEKSKKSSK